MIGVNNNVNTLKDYFEMARPYMLIITEARNFENNGSISLKLRMVDEKKDVNLVIIVPYITAQDSKLDVIEFYVKLMKEKLDNHDPSMEDFWISKAAV